MPEEKDKKLEYLKRGEIRTMQKDIAKLREMEASQEREKVSQIKTEEEVQREKEREEKAQKAAMAREMAEKEAKRKEEELKKLREERKEQTEVIEKEEIKKEEKEAAGFKGLLKETQAREEEERKRFLERVEAKAEGKETPVAPVPPPAPPPPPEKPPERPPEKPEGPKPLQILKKIPKPVLRRPSFVQKLWIRVVLTLLVLAIIGAIATFWYWYFVVREKPVPTLPVAEEKAEEELIIPSALISTEASQILELPLLAQILKEDLGEDQFTRLIIKDPEKNKVLGLRELFTAFEVETPATFYDKVGNDFTLFAHSSQGTNRLGFVAEVKEADLLYLLKYWENTMEADFENFSVFLGKTGLPLVPYFREVIYKNIPFRYLSFPPQNFGICWAIVNDYFVLTFSGETIIKAIDKLE